MSMYSDAAIARKFVEGNVQGRMYIIFDALRTFVDENGPIIEQINAQTILLDKQEFRAVLKMHIEDLFRKDAEGAKKSLATYNRIFGRIEHHLAMMSSNFQLPSFLAENGIDAQEIGVIQDAIRAYWNDTYGPIMQDIRTAKEKLDILRKMLDEEVKILESMPATSFFEGFEKSHELRNLFQQERSTFWELAKHLKASEKTFQTIDILFKIERRKIKEMILAYIRVIKKGMQTDWNETLSIRKALLLLAYLLGAVNVFMNLKKLFVTKSVGAISDYLVRKKTEKISKITEKLITATEDLGSNMGEAAIANLNSLASIL